MRERSDEKLMKAYAGGDMTAFELLYDRHRGPLYRYFLGQVRDAAIANDLFQGTWEKIVRARRKYRPSAPFGAWLYRIAHNHLMDHYRRRRPTEELPPESPDNAAPGPEQQALRQARSSELGRAIAGLPAEQRDSLLLKLETGLDLQTIADVTGVKRETAKSRLRYAVAGLKKRMRD